jgi:ABC-type branched-subunit amino acid transport system substrate-binding protein
MTRVRALAAVGLALVALVGCGSTVPLDRAESSSPVGLTLPTVGTTAPGTVGTPTGGGTAATVGGSSGPPSSGATGAGPTADATRSGRGSTSPTASASTSGTPSKSAGGGPIQIGFLNTGISNALSFVGSTGQTVAAQTVFQAMVKYYNAHGGLDGRKVVPVVAQTDTADASWSADYQAACQKFTQDNHVATVVGYSFAYIPTFESCLSKAGVPHITGGYATGDTETFRQYPYLVSTTGITDDRRYLVELESAVQQGLLKQGDKLGILIDGCAEEMRAYKDTVVPYLAAEHLTPVLSTEDCAQGATDDAAVVAQIQTAVLKFRSLGVNRIVTEGPPVLVFSEEAQAQGWHPLYLLTSASGGASLQGTVPVAQEENIHGAGWMPEVDVSLNGRPMLTAPERHCLSMLKTEGIVPREYNDYLYAYTTCDGFSLYATALAHDGGSTAAASVVSAIVGLGRSWHGASMIDGATRFTATQRDAPAEYRPWGWVKSCNCFTYTGAARSLP